MSVCAHMCEVIGEAHMEIIPVLRSVPVDIPCRSVHLHVSNAGLQAEPRIGYNVGCAVPQC